MTTTADRAFMIAQRRAVGFERWTDAYQDACGEALQACARGIAFHSDILATLQKFGRGVGMQAEHGLAVVALEREWMAQMKAMAVAGGQDGEGPARAAYGKWCALET